MKSTRIYALVDPTSLEIRYVGKTVKSIKYRLDQHIRLSRCNDQTHKSKWIRSLTKEGYSPYVFELEVAIENWQESEQFWIAYLRSIGCRLTNYTDGGDGVLGRKLSDETKRKIGDKHLGKFVSAEARAKMSLAKKGKKHSATHSARIVSSRNKFNEQVEERLTDYIESGASIFDLNKAGFSNRSIGRRFGVSHHAVRTMLETCL